MEQRNLDEDESLGMIRQRLEDFKPEIRTEMSIFFDFGIDKNKYLSVCSSSSAILRRTMFLSQFQSLLTSSLRHVAIYGTHFIMNQNRAGY